MNIRVATINDLPTIEKLAREIWPGTYGDILRPDQLDYMLQFIYSQTSLQNQMLQQQHNFLMVEWEGEPVGFADYSLYAPGVYKLHKIYVHGSMQGKGVGKTLIEYIMNIVKGHTLRLNVNRHNKARYFYEKLGFVVTGEEDVDIGNGYFMNDYVMELFLPHS
jgi:N-acetylglutamate synthase-like GNAT family acetyltransferase